MPLATIATAIVFVLFPVRTIINKAVINIDNLLDDKINYFNEFDKFTCDYDRENPITKKEGFLRILEYKN